MNIHFMGINGSGVSGVACIAKNKGFNVTGCDMVDVGDYTDQLINNNITIFKGGHNKEHLKNVDIVVASPAIFYKEKYKQIEEANIAFEQHKLIKWQEFLGKFIMKNQNVVCVVGTHGKTTNTTLMSLILEKANFDPTCLVGGGVKEWHRTYRIGNSKYFVCEGDEFDGNFLYYNPKYVIINNIEMDHPERFANFNDYLNIYRRFIETIQENGIIVFLFEEETVLNLIIEFKDLFKNKNIKCFGITFDKNQKQYEGIETIYFEKESNGIKIDNTLIEMQLLGYHNIKNIAVTTALSLKMNINIKTIQEVIKNFKGSKRRMDLVYSDNNIKLYDDYAHHQTQIQCTLGAIKESKLKNEKIIAILEPHMISRIKNNTKSFINALLQADYSIITKIFKSRESFLSDVNVVEMINNKKILYIEKQDDVISKVIELTQNKNNMWIVVVMGAGLSYQITSRLKDFFSHK